MTYTPAVRSAAVPQPVFDQWWANRSNPPVLDAWTGLHRLFTSGSAK